MSFSDKKAASLLPSIQQKFVNEVITALRTGPSKQDLARQFLDTGVHIPRFLVGRNEEAKALQELVRIDGVIDDFTAASEDGQGTPIVKSRELPGNAWVVNCSTSISPVNVNKRLAALKLQRCIGINQIIQASGGALAWSWFVRDQRSSIEHHLVEWAQLYERLADEESREMLLNVVRFRLTADASYMQHYQVRSQDQYFEDFMDYSQEVFVDAGGFDGDTTEAFCRRYPDYKKVYLFEPSDINLQAARRRLSALRDINFMPMALSDREEVLSFDASAGSASAVNASAPVKVRACRLDDVMEESVSFIKMDLEGWEMKALAGASNLIARHKCKLAISVYHSASDFLAVPRFLLEINPRYRIYLRHYTQGWSETVMFFRE
ncbi:MAG TPA: FkbM family methyltransferase [Dongiaceae bacterium]|jgi:FkbM family methyltransferase|nr:FkbM family methyltransferase [Dongiaceae bacterium]